MKGLLNVSGAHQFTSSYFSHLAFYIFVQYVLLHSCHGGIHLSKTISFTALDLAKNAGMAEEDISAAAMLAGGEDLEDENEEARQIDQDDIPPITDFVDSFRGPVLPLCCSREADDLLYYQCGGSSVSKENLNDNNNGIQRSWTAPPNLVSTKSSTEFRYEGKTAPIFTIAIPQVAPIFENA